MEEVINKPDGQFKDILDDLVDYKNQYTSKKNPLIEELDRLKPSIKPAASLNSSLYSSTASSSSSTASDSSASSTSSASSSPSQSQVQANLQHSTVCHEFGRMEELGKTAKILENRLVPSVLNAVPSSSSSSSTAAKPSKINNEAINTACPILSQTIAHKYVSAGSVLSSNSNDISMPTSSTSSSNLINGNSWKTISAKRDKRRKKNEHIIHAGELPGARGIGDPPVEELVMFIEVSFFSTLNNHTAIESCQFPHRQTPPFLGYPKVSARARDLTLIVSFSSSSSSSSQLSLPCYSPEQTAPPQTPTRIRIIKASHKLTLLVDLTTKTTTITTTTTIIVVVTTAIILTIPIPITKMHKTQLMPITTTTTQTVL